jgi:hypothetical protein
MQGFSKLSFSGSSGNFANRNRALKSPAAYVFLNVMSTYIKQAT